MYLYTLLFFFFFNDTATTEIYTLPLHDALPISPVLILDEATSHLDAVSEAAVRAAFERLARDRTTLVIAHRLSTVRDADAIIVLDDGRVVEAGRHAELLARGDLYAHPVARQHGGMFAAAAD